MSEFDIDVNPKDIGLPEVKQTTGDCPKCGKNVRLKADGECWKHDCGPVVDVKIDVEPTKPAPPKTIKIMIDAVDGKSNYEVVGVNGKIYQIKRGVPVDVPPEVVEVLKNAVETRLSQSKNPRTGEMEEVRTDVPAIPWRKV